MASTLADTMSPNLSICVRNTVCIRSSALSFLSWVCALSSPLVSLGSEGERGLDQPSFSFSQTASFRPLEDGQKLGRPCGPPRSLRLAPSIWTENVAFTTFANTYMCIVPPARRPSCWRGGGRVLLYSVLCSPEDIRTWECAWASWILYANTF